MKKPKLVTVQMPIIDHKATGELVRSLRLGLNVSLREMARRLGISPAFLSDLERGRRNWTQEFFDEWWAEATTPTPRKKEVK